MGQLHCFFSKEELVERLLNRAKQGGRVDDTPDIIEKRIQTYKMTTLKVAEHYLEQGKLHEVNGVGKIDDIFEDISTIIDQLDQK